LSYLLYLARFSKSAARAYFSMALWMCRQSGTEPSILLHPLDFLSSEDAPELKFFPAMNLPLEKKLEFVSEILGTLDNKFEIVNMREHAERFASSARRTMEAKIGIA